MKAYSPRGKSAPEMEIESDNAHRFHCLNRAHLFQLVGFFYPIFGLALASPAWL